MSTCSWCHSATRAWCWASSLAGQRLGQRRRGASPRPPTPAASPWTTHLVTASWASWLGGGTRKHTEGTAASLPELLSTFQWDGCAGPTS